MYLHIGDDKIVFTDDVIGIFDMDTATVTETGKNYLRRAEKEGILETTGESLPKTFIVCAGKKEKIYVTPISTLTLLKRVQRGIDQELNILED